MMMPPYRHAVCLTGEERSFGEVGGSIQAGLRALSGSVHVFGVRPARNGSWAIIPRLLPLVAVEAQERCFTPLEANLTIGWMHCDFHGRTGDCRLSFLQALCDLARCEAMISAYERRENRNFTSVLRLRADLFWEATLDVPRPLQPNTICAAPSRLRTLTTTQCRVSLSLSPSPHRLPPPPASRRLYTLLPTARSPNSPQTCLPWTPPRA